MSVEKIKYCMVASSVKAPQGNIQKMAEKHGAGEMNGKKLIVKPLKNLQQNGMTLIGLRKLHTGVMIKNPNQHTQLYPALPSSTQLYPALPSSTQLYPALPSTATLRATNQ